MQHYILFIWKKNSLCHLYASDIFHMIMDCFIIFFRKIQHQWTFSFYSAKLCAQYKSRHTNGEKKKRKIIRDIYTIFRDGITVYHRQDECVLFVCTADIISIGIIWIIQCVRYWPSVYVIKQTMKLPRNSIWHSHY